MAKSLKQIREAIGTATAIGKPGGQGGPRRGRGVTSQRTKGNLPKRFALIRGGGHALRIASPIIREAINQVKEKMPVGKTDTNEPADTVNTEVKLSPTNGY